MADRTWKAVERRIAAFFGCRRVPGSGALWREYETRSDSDHPRLYVEAKHRARFAVLTLWRDTRDKARREGKTPVVALAEKSRHGFWILCHSHDLAAVADEIADTEASGDSEDTAGYGNTDTDFQLGKLDGNPVRRAGETQRPATGRRRGKET